MLTAERARQLFSYNKRTGVLRWKVNRSQARVGDAAAHLANSGRLAVRIDGRSYLVHRVIWLIVMGRWPTFTIDHEDTDTTNNRWKNLRDIPHQINNQNHRLPRRDNSIGLLGVSYDRARDKFKAAVQTDGKTVWRKRFDCPLDAHLAYVENKRRLHPGCTI